MVCVVYVKHPEDLREYPHVSLCNDLVFAIETPEVDESCIAATCESESEYYLILRNPITGVLSISAETPESLRRTVTAMAPSYSDLRHTCWCSWLCSISDSVPVLECRHTYESLYMFHHGITKPVPNIRVLDRGGRMYISTGTGQITLESWPQLMAGKPVAFGRMNAGRFKMIGMGHFEWIRANWILHVTIPGRLKFDMGPRETCCVYDPAT